MVGPLCSDGYMGSALIPLGIRYYINRWVKTQLSKRGRRVIIVHISNQIQKQTKTCIYARSINGFRYRTAYAGIRGPRGTCDTLKITRTVPSIHPYLLQWKKCRPSSHTLIFARVKCVEEGGNNTVHVRYVTVTVVESPRDGDRKRTREKLTIIP